MVMFCALLTFMDAPVTSDTFCMINAKYSTCAPYYASTLILYCCDYLCRASITVTRDAGALDGESADANVHSWEVRLVLEYCDLGALREALNAKAFFHANTNQVSRLGCRLQV